jgi:hypothetical protein
MQGRRDRMRALDNHLERLSGKYLNGSDRAFLDSAERRKCAISPPRVRALLGPRNGARSEFPDSL